MKNDNGQAAKGNVSRTGKTLPTNGLPEFGKKTLFPSISATGDIRENDQQSFIKNKSITMYYICKFRGTWSIYDGTKGVDRILEKSETDLLKALFPSLLADASVLVALQINSISPNKLQQLTSGTDAGPQTMKDK